MGDEAAEYWRKFEEETGERVVARCIGEWLREPGDERGLWGLLVLTDRSLRFRHIPSENWISSLFKSQSRSSRPNEPVEFVMPRAGILRVEEPRRGFLARLFGPAFRVVGVARREGDSERVERFSVDPSGDLLKALRAL